MKLVLNFKHCNKSVILKLTCLGSKILTRPFCFNVKIVVFIWLVREHLAFCPVFSLVGNTKPFWECQLLYFVKTQELLNVCHLVLLLCDTRVNLNQQRIPNINITNTFGHGHSRPVAKVCCDAKVVNFLEGFWSLIPHRRGIIFFWDQNI